MVNRRIALPSPVSTIYRAVQELSALYPGRPFTPDGHMVGSIGEVIAAEAFGLTLYPPSQATHDAFDEQGDVQIKMTGGTCISMYSCCDRLLVLRVVNPQEAEVVYDGPGGAGLATSRGHAEKRAAEGLARKAALDRRLALDAIVDPDALISLVAPEMRRRSGAVFYSGRHAFTSRARLYVLGLNPGGSPVRQAGETIGRDLDVWRSGPERWSAYLDRSWRGRPAGTFGIQPRIRHMLDGLDLDPRDVPASNAVFVRTASEADLTTEKQALLAQCWPVHRAIIETLGISTVACLGGTAGHWVRSLLGATKPAGRFVERNSRKWASEAHLSDAGLCVITLTHPGRADWRNPASDPTPLVREMLER